MAQKRLKNFSIFWVFSAMRTWVSMFFLELGPGRSIAIIIGMKKKIDANTCWSSFEFRM